MPYKVEIKEVETRPAAIVRFTANVSEMGEKMGIAFGQVMQYVAQTGAQIAGPAIGYYEQPGGDRFDVRSGFIVAAPIEGDGTVLPFELPAGKVATTVHVGPYETLPEAYAALAEQTKAQGVEIDLGSPMWEEYLSGPETPPEQIQTVIYWPLKQ